MTDDIGARGRALLDAGRAADALPDDVRARVWQRLERELPIGVGAGAGATWKWAVAAVALAAGIAALWMGRQALVPGDGEAPDAAGYQRGDGPAIEAAPVEAPAAPGEITPSRAEAVTPPPAELPVADGDGPRDGSIEAAPRRRPTDGAPRRPAADPPRSPPAPIDGFADEVARLRTAQAALRDRPAHSLALLEALDADHPHGALMPERAALRVFALCGAGEGAKARTAAARFAERHPSSPLLGRVRSTCVDGAEEKSPAP